MARRTRVCGVKTRLHGTDATVKKARKLRGGKRAESATVVVNGTFRSSSTQHRRQVHTHTHTHTPALRGQINDMQGSGTLAPAILGSTNIEL